MVFALPPGMAQALELVHRGSTFRVLGGSRQRASRWTHEYVKLLLSPRHSRGITLVYLVLPILGPSDLRDAGGAAADTVATGSIPGVQQVFDTVYFDPAVHGLYAVDQRSQVPFRYYRSGSAFEYDLVRFLFTQKRKLDVAK